MDIPQVVMEKAKGLIQLYGPNFAYLGKYENQQVFMFQFPENTETGFPFLYLYNEASDNVTEVTGLDALEMINTIQDK